MSEKSGTNGNCNYLSYFYLQVKLKVKRLKMALTFDERVEIVLLSGRQGWTQRQVADEFNACIKDCCATVDPNVEQNPHKHGNAAENMRSVRVNI
jgi:hypothetical protein